jgi:amidase
MRKICLFLLLSTNLIAGAQSDVDRVLSEVSVAQLHAFYARGIWTVEQVVRGEIARVERVDAGYKSVLFLDKEGALAEARRLDAEGPGLRLKGAMWGVPIMVKANTSVKGWVTSAGWTGYMVPGKELVAPKDALVVRRLREAGAVLLGQTNMPDFAGSDTNVSSAGGRTGNAFGAKYSPGGSSGGTAVAVSLGFAVAGTGTDTSNSIRNPSASNAVVGVLPSRGLTSIAGIQPLHWLFDNTGPIARSVTDAAVMLGAMVGAADPLDMRSVDCAAVRDCGPYLGYLKKDSLKGRRFGVPAFVLAGEGDAGPEYWNGGTSPETRAVFLKALDQLRAAGAEVVIADDLLPVSFAKTFRKIDARAFQAQGNREFLKEFGTTLYHSPEELKAATGKEIWPRLMGTGPDPVKQRTLRAAYSHDPESDRLFWEPQRVALAEYDAALARWNLDGLVYPAVQVSPRDESVPVPKGYPSDGPYTETGWVNRIGVPAVAVPGGWYENGLPFGLEFSGRRWQDGRLLGWAYGYEQNSRNRHSPMGQK